MNVLDDEVKMKMKEDDGLERCNEHFKNFGGIFLIIFK